MLTVACGSGGDSQGTTGNDSGDNNEQESFTVIALTKQSGGNNVPVLAMKGERFGDTLAVLADTTTDGTVTAFKGALFADGSGDYFKVSLNNEGAPARVDFKNGTYVVFSDYDNNVATISVYDASNTKVGTDRLSFDAEKMSKLQKLYSQNAKVPAVSASPSDGLDSQPQAFTNPFSSSHKAGWLSLGSTASNFVGCALSVKAAFASSVIPPALLATVPLAGFSCTSAIVSAFASFTDKEAIDDVSRTFDEIGCVSLDPFACVALIFEVKADMEEGKIKLRDGLVAEYLFEGNAKDTSGQGHHGTKFGNVQYVQRGEGKVAYLKNANDYIGIEKDFRLNEFTVSFFVNIETKTEWNMFLNGANSGQHNAFNFSWSSSRRVVEGIILGRVNNYHLYYSTDKDFTNNWNHFAYVHGGNGLIELYLNGQHVKQLGQQISDSRVDIEYLVIGNDQDCLRGCYEANQSLLGKIDDVRIYDRALSEAEIKSLYLVNGSGDSSGDFGERDPGKDFDTLNATGNSNPQGIWSDGTTVWVVDEADDKIYAYDMATKAYDSSKDFNTLSAANSNSPEGIWSDGTTMWVADSIDSKIYAYDMASKARDSSKDFNTLSSAGNNRPDAIWSDGTTLWVVDWDDDKIYAYNLVAKARDSAKDFNTLTVAGNDSPQGIWSDGKTMWVADSVDYKLYAYNLASKARNSGKDFDTLGVAGNNTPEGIWSDGTTMWVVDHSDHKIYAYKLK